MAVTVTLSPLPLHPKHPIHWLAATSGCHPHSVSVGTPSELDNVALSLPTHLLISDLATLFPSATEIAPAALVPALDIPHRANLRTASVPFPRRLSLATPQALPQSRRSRIR